MWRGNPLSGKSTGTNIEQDDDDDSLEYSLTVQLDDGTAFEFPVTEELYEMEESGTEFVVCQRGNPLGVRMLDLHLPPENSHRYFINGTDKSKLQ